MATQLLRAEKNATVIPDTKKEDIYKSAGKETYVIYSIYYSNEPEGGHVIYACTKRGWEFFGDMPAGKHPQIAAPRLRHGKFSHL